MVVLDAGALQKFAYRRRTAARLASQHRSEIVVFSALTSDKSMHALSLEERHICRRITDADTGTDTGTDTDTETDTHTDRHRDRQRQRHRQRHRRTEIQTHTEMRQRGETDLLPRQTAEWRQAQSPV